MSELTEEELEIARKLGLAIAIVLFVLAAIPLAVVLVVVTLGLLGFKAAFVGAVNGSPTQALIALALGITVPCFVLWTLNATGMINLRDRAERMIGRILIAGILTATAAGAGKALGVDARASSQSNQSAPTQTGHPE